MKYETHREFVRKLCKAGSVIAEELTPDDCHRLHMAIGISGEAGEFAQAIDEGLSPSQIAKIGLTLSSALTAAGFRKLPKSSGKTLWFKPIPPGTVAMKGNGLPSATHRGAEREKFSR